MTKTDFLLERLNANKLPQNIIKDALRGSKGIKKADIGKYARGVVQDYLDKMVENNGGK